MDLKETDARNWTEIIRLRIGTSSDCCEHCDERERVQSVNNYSVNKVTSFG